MSQTVTDPNAVLPINDPLPPIAPSGITLGLQKVADLPMTGAPGSPPLANVQFAVAAPDGSGDLFVGDQRGVIYHLDPGTGALTTFLDLRDWNVGLDSGGSAENGLVGLAFDPNFDGDPALPGYGTFYTDYAAYPGASPVDFGPGGALDHIQTIRAWTMADPGAATFDGTSRVVLALGKEINNHNGGTIGFDPNAMPGSPDYGKLYIGVGDDGAVNDPDNNAQTVESPLGKILRIDPHVQPDGAQYGIPADNPFVSEGGAAPLVWALGLRNPQQFSWEQGGEGRMFIDDVGQDRIEEVNLGAKGADYGWHLRQGDFATGFAVGHDASDVNIYPVPAGTGSDGFTSPIAEYSHTEYTSEVVASAIGGGFLYHGTDMPDLVGKYVFSELVQGRLFFIDPSQGSPGHDAPIQSIALELGGQVFNDLDASSLGYVGYNGDRTDMRLGEDSNGELYALFKGPGSVYRLVEDTAPPHSVTIGSGPDIIELHVSEDAYQGAAQFTVSIDGQQVGGTLTATASHAAGQEQVVDVLGSFAAGQHTVAVSFLNDLYDGTPHTDRNLYVDSITANGVMTPTAAAFLSAGTQEFQLKAAAPAIIVGSGANVIELRVSEDTYQGDAQFAVSVDGQQVGGTLTATALHAVGQEQVVDVLGSFAAGQHRVEVSFLNDLYGGTPDTDRNLYVDSITVGGVVTTTAAAFMSAGTQSFVVVQPGAESHLLGSV